jgi:hypothetical protein
VMVGLPKSAHEKLKVLVKKGRNKGDAGRTWEENSINKSSKRATCSKESKSMSTLSEGVFEPWPFAIFVLNASNNTQSMYSSPLCNYLLTIVKISIKY